MCIMRQAQAQASLILSAVGITQPTFEVSFHQITTEAETTYESSNLNDEFMDSDNPDLEVALMYAKYQIQEAPAGTSKYMIFLVICAPIVSLLPVHIRQTTLEIYHRN